MNDHIRKRENLPTKYREGNAPKKSGYPTQPGNRSTTPRQPSKKRKKQINICKIVRIFKRIKWGRIVALLLVIFCVSKLASCAINSDTSVTAEEQKQQPTQTAEYIFRDGNGSPVDIQSMTNAWAAESGTEKRYDLTDAERWEVASVVTAEASGEPFAGMVAVAQCVLQACEDDGIRPCEAVVKYKYTKNRPEPSEEALEAVQAVFDFGQVATHQPIKFFYAPARVYSEWHESQDYVMTVNNHKFFTERSTKE